METLYNHFDDVIFRRPRSPDPAHSDKGSGPELRHPSVLLPRRRRWLTHHLLSRGEEGGQGQLLDHSRHFPRTVVPDNWTHRGNALPVQSGCRKQTRLVFVKKV